MFLRRAVDAVSVEDRGPSRVEKLHGDRRAGVVRLEHRRLRLHLVAGEVLQLTLALEDVVNRVFA